jgi:hypothetical protein
VSRGGRRVHFWSREIKALNIMHLSLGRIRMLLVPFEPISGFRLTFQANLDNRIALWETGRFFMEAFPQEIPLSWRRWLLPIRIGTILFPGAFGFLRHRLRRFIYRMENR